MCKALDDLTSKANIVSQLLVRQRSLHVVQLLLHHRLRHLSLHPPRVVGRAEDRALRIWSCNACRVRRRDRTSAAPWRRSMRRRQTKKIATAVVPDRPLGWNIAHRLGTRVASTRPCAGELRPRPLDPALADFNRAFDLALRSNVNALVALLPVDRAAFAELVLEDQSVEDALRLVYGAAYVRIVDRHGADLALGIDDEKRSLCYPFVFDQDAVVAAQLVVAIADQGHMDASQAAFHVRGSVPRPEAELGVGTGESNGTGAAVQELLEASAEGADFRGADEGPCFGKEDQDKPVVGLSVSRQRDFCPLSSVNGNANEESKLYGCAIPLMRPSTTALHSNAGASWPTVIFL